MDVLNVAAIAELRMKFERQLNALAAALGHKLNQADLDQLIDGLGHFGLTRLTEACLVLREETKAAGSFPTLGEFETVIRAMGLVR